MQRVAALYQFCQQLEQTQQFSRVRVNDDRYIVLHTDAGELVVIYFTDMRLSARAMQQALCDNTMRGIYSLFVLDAKLLPPHATHVILSPFLNTVQTLYHGTIYTYHSHNGAVQVVPVSVRSAGNDTAGKSIIYGAPIDPRDLTCGHVETGFPIQGFWGTVNFKTQVEYTGFDAGQRASFSQAYRQQSQQRRGSAEQRAYQHLNGKTNSRASREHYVVLELPVDASEAQVRAAYRRLARQYHPDLNPSPEAKHRMQEINQAYKILMQQFS
jgi:hypothetical protein